MADLTSRRVGIGGFIGWAEESTFGTAVAAANYLQIAPGDETLQFDQGFIEGAHTAERGVDVADVVKGMGAVSGTWGHDLRYGGGWGLLLEHLIADEVLTAGASPYTHNFDVGVYASGMAGKGLSFVINRDGLLASSDQAARYYGCRPTAVTFTCEDNGICRAEWTLIGIGADYVAMPTPTYPTANYIKAPSDAASPTAGFSFDGDTYPCRRWSLTIAQPWDPVRTVQAAAGKEPTLGGRIEVTGSFEILAQGTGTAGASDNPTTNFRAGTDGPLVLTLEGPTAASESLVFNAPDVRVVAPPEVHMSETGAIWQTVEFKAYRNGAAHELDITLTNSDTTLDS